MAERTRQRATDLTRDTKRAPVGFRDIDDFDLMAACNPYEIFARAIVGNVLGNYLWHRHHEVVSQLGAVVLGEIGHFREIAHTPVIDPLPNLIDAHLGLLFRRTNRDQGLFQLRTGQPHKVLRSLGYFPGDCQNILSYWRTSGHHVHPLSGSNRAYKAAARISQAKPAVSLGLRFIQ